MKFFERFITWKLLFSEGDKNLVRGTILAGLFLGEWAGMSKYLANRGAPHPPSSGNPSVGTRFIHTLIHIHLPILSQHIQPIVGMQLRLPAYALL